MTMIALREGDMALLPVRVLIPSSLALVRIETDFSGGHRDVTAPYSNLRLPVSVDAAYEALRVMRQRSEDIRVLAEGLCSVGALVQAEVHELGIFTGTGKTGLGPPIPTDGMRALGAAFTVTSR